MRGAPQVDRARAIFTHGAQFENPKRAPDYWKAWHDFEVAHGNEDTFRDMLRVKRSVLTSFANETFYDMASSEVSAARTCGCERRRDRRGRLVAAAAAAAAAAARSCRGSVFDLVLYTSSPLHIVPLQSDAEAPINPQ